MKKLASWQPYLYGLGMAWVSLFLMGAGTLGVPRRGWDITFSGTGGVVHEFPAANTLLALNGLSVLLAVAGGAAFCTIIVASLLFGKKLDEDEAMTTSIIATPPSDADYVGIGKGAISVPGTLTRP